MRTSHIASYPSCLAVGSVDRDQRGAQGHLQLTRQAGTGIPDHAGERGADL